MIELAHGGAGLRLFWIVFLDAKRRQAIENAEFAFS